ncbi:uncharacterized protein LOC133310005 [Gastrolobium bilobum]|uniref:uncharacterized protein LOC133310005 n=1 Tax=Gastrolobium bilobum TaxID=150636 RepID=UPI002AB2ED44|nr:uncharacterized protein LOC133310005 [Gastrolobium bilobum]
MADDLRLEFQREIQATCMDLNQKLDVLTDSIMAMDARLKEFIFHSQPQSHSVGSSNHSSMTNTHFHQEAPDQRLLKLVKMEIPSFHGSDPNNWIFKAELYFSMQQIPPHLKVQLAGLKMEGQAAPWFQWMFHTGTIHQWEEFTKAVRQIFGVSAFVDLRGSLSKLSQTGSLCDYVKEYEILLNQVPGFTDDVLMSFFISGLHPDLRGAIQLQWPKSLHNAMQLAYALDTHHEQLRSSLSIPSKKPSWSTSHTSNSDASSFHKSATTSTMTQPVSTTTPRTMSTSSSTLPIKRLPPEEIARKRELGLCYTCDEKWTARHRSKSQMLLLFGEMEEETPEAEEEIVWTPNNQNESVEATLHALSGSLSPRALILEARISDHLVRVLVDSGSSHNFISRELATTLQMPIIQARGMKVFMGNDSDVKLQGVAECSNSDSKVHTSQASCCTLLAQAESEVGVQVIPELMALQSTIAKVLWQVLKKYQLVFQTPHALPPFRGMDHSIHLVEAAKPVSVRPYRFPHHQKSELEKQVSDLMTAGMIQTSKSSFSSPVLLLKKQDGNWRMCIDYRALNAITIPDRFPIPTIDELLDELLGATIFSKLNLRAGYHQIRMLPQNVNKTTFRTHEGHYEFLVMPFGLTNAPSTFQSAMNQIFRPFLRRFVIVFFDDILVYSATIEEHAIHLDSVLACLQHHAFFVKLSKCAFGQSEISYLGHIVCAEGVKADPQKVAAMLDWPQPVNIKQLRAFLGLISYYRKFVHQYANVAWPLTELLKSEKLCWSSAASKAFDDLKTAMSITPILSLPDFSAVFIVETDASNYGIGAVLIQHGRPLSFFSKKLGP